MDAVAETLKNYLDEKACQYELLTHEAMDSLVDVAHRHGIPPGNVARAVLLQHGVEHLVVVLPLDHIIDFNSLNELTGKSWTPVPVKEAGDLFKDCDENIIPVFGQAYALETLFDKSVMQLAEVFLEAGKHTALIAIRQEQLSQLVDVDIQKEFAKPEQSLDESSGEHLADRQRLNRYTPSDETLKMLGRVYELPVLSAHIGRIIQIRNDPDATAKDLAELVEADSGLAAQVLRYARSPFFGIASEVKTIQDAITLALGFDMVINLALGLATLKPFANQSEGPLGMHTLTHDSVLAASLAQKLVKKYKQISTVTPGEAYLAGLIHNLGFLLLGHLFKAEYFLLNKMVKANPNLPVTTLESRLLVSGQARELMQLGHAKAGAMLLDQWGLPHEIAVACQEHHNPEYDGLHFELANLLLLVGRLLKPYGVGDACSDEIPVQVLQRLGLSDCKDQLKQDVEELMESHSDSGWLK